jgi:hypothetical protein
VRKEQLSKGEKERVSYLLLSYVEDERSTGLKARYFWKQGFGVTFQRGQKYSGSSVASVLSSEPGGVAG